MNSLEELNRSSDTIEYTDTRTPNVTFNTPTPADYFLTIGEGTAHNVPVGVEITEIINYDASLPTYTIDLTDLPTATATWGTLPAYITIDNTTSGVYIVSGLKTLSDWNLVKSPEILMPNNYNGVWSYTPTINYVYQSIVQTVNWSVIVEVVDSNMFSDIVDLVYDTSSTFSLGAPTVTDTGVLNPTYTVTITPSSAASVSTISTSGSGGTVSLNGTTKVLTIVGTKTQVNSHLETVTMTSNTVESDFSITYLVVSSLVESDTKIQNLKCSSILYLNVVRTPSIYYIEDTSTVISGGPTISDTGYDGSGTYTYTITPSNGSGVITMSATGTGGSTSFNSSSKVLTITGTRTEVNSYIDNITFQPGVDFVLDFYLSYKVVTPRGASATATKTQNILIGSQDTEIININTNRNYWSNTTNYPFATTSYKIAQTQYSVTYSRTSTPTLANNSSSPWVDAIIPKYGTACLGINRNTYDGVDDLVTIVPTTSITMSDWTIESWYLDAYQTLTSPYYDVASGIFFDSQTPVSGTTISSDGVAIQLYSASSPSRGKIIVYENGSLVAQVDNIYNTDITWHHIAVSKSGSTVRIFNDGNLVGSYTSNNSLTLRNTDGWVMGKGRSRVSQNPDGTGPINLTSANFNGYLDDFRISNSGIYTSNFTPGPGSRNPYSIFYFAFDGNDNQWPPSGPTGRTGLPLTSTQITPSISDNDITNPTYTIQLTCSSSLGSFSIDGTTYTSNFSFTGTKAQCNSAFSSIRFQPVGSSTGNVTYTQRKNGVTQISQTITFVGNAGVSV